jgi:hypothetical protein
MFKSKRDPRVGDFVKLIFIKEPNKFTNFNSLFLFLHQLYPMFKFDFFDDEYLETMFRESEEEESEEELEESEEPKEEFVEDRMNMTTQKSEQNLDNPALRPPSFGNLDGSEKIQLGDNVNGKGISPV